ncbi:hypothetical protein AALP_AAs51623U000100 [Arabis alpina]|uniref:Uncharacterized protein n=1 Tax=Arabis alpina TaxID=50452 RepID=A0A087FZY8_ARAAL|nr:hypothetical protein AALP_AAs51623U000100 [Arabis alpina]
MGSETEKKVKSFEANLGDNIHRESMSSGSSEEGEVVNEESPKKEETNQGVDISSGVSSKDTEKSGNGQSLTNGTNNLRELMKKPIRLLWIVISIHVVTALLRGKGNRK